MKTPIEMLKDKCKILCIDFHAGELLKKIFILDVDMEQDMEKNFINFNNVDAIETYQQVEYLSPKSTRTQLKFAIFPRTFAISTKLISRITLLESVDAEYPGASTMLSGLYAKHIGIETPPEKKIEIAS